MDKHGCISITDPWTWDLECPRILWSYSSDPEFTKFNHENTYILRLRGCRLPTYISRYQGNSLHYISIFMVGLENLWLASHFTFCHKTRPLPQITRPQHVRWLGTYTSIWKIKIYLLKLESLLHYDWHTFIDKFGSCSIELS